MEQKDEIIAFLRALQAKIILAFESIEQGAFFEKKHWHHPFGGGGEINILRGSVFEKAAVNWSGVYGDTFPMDDAQGSFFATGVSLITHMSNPHMPTVHMNLRYIQTEQKSWFGGGYDLTPMGLTKEEDKMHFHQVAKETLTPFGDELYPLFSKQAQEYFFIPHRNRERGVGGIFFDHYDTGDKKKDLALWKAVGDSFLPAILPLYEHRACIPFSPGEKELQLQERALYAEFNLVYDRGTKFGFLSKGNTEAILCSMPPLAKW